MRLEKRLSTESTVTSRKDFDVVIVGKLLSHVKRTPKLGKLRVLRPARISTFLVLEIIYCVCNP